MLDVRHDFPILERTVRHGKPLVYLDSAATSHKPIQVLDAERDFYRLHNAAVSRGAHLLGEEATEAFETARAQVARLIGAVTQEVVWASNATAAINLVAGGMANASVGIGAPESRLFAVGPGQRVVITQTDHHANIIPWQQLCAATGAELAHIPVDDDGRMMLEGLDQIITDNTVMVAVQHASNVTGIVHDVETIRARAHSVGAWVLLDACQSVPHLPVDVTQLGVDFLVMSAHKMLGPTGIGALWGKKHLLDVLPPSIFGGSTIKTVTMTETTWLDAPMRFEAGSQPVAQAVGMGAAADYMLALGMDAIAAHEASLGSRLRRAVSEIPGVRLLGPLGDDETTLGLAAVVVDGVHAHDVGQVLDDAGIAVRVGHHCTQPLHRHFGIASSTRASCHVYNTEDDVDAFVEALSGVRAFFGVS